MKRLFILIAFLALGASKVEAAFGTLPDYKVKLWKSSFTETAVRTTQFSSGPVIIHSIIIGTYTVNGGGFLAMSRSTSTEIGNWMSTFTVVATNNLIAASDMDRQYFYDVISDSYTFVQRVGTAKITILWDWLDGQFANPTPE